MKPSCLKTHPTVACPVLATGWIVRSGALACLLDWIQNWSISTVIFGVTGTRVDLYPNIYWNRYSSWGFIKPGLGFRYTGYDLDRQGAPGDESPQRSTMIASLDAGLVFDRTTSNGNLQTLEPRLFYLYVPYKQQDDLPIFDTGEFTFGISQLFNTNRFAGSDRQSDANQLSLAVTTNNYSGRSGQALWSLSLGQIFYFDQRRVQLGDKAGDR